MLFKMCLLMIKRTSQKTFFIFIFAQSTHTHTLHNDIPEVLANISSLTIFLQNYDITRLIINISEYVHLPHTV